MQLIDVVTTSEVLAHTQTHVNMPKSPSQQKVLVGVMNKAHAT
jgi:peptidoglycan/xylan/chitin deacetylase (PgdA/CDA1 family)